MMLLWVIVLQTCFLSGDFFSPTEINDLCKNSVISDQLGYGYASEATCSREYYQCTPSLNTYTVKLMYCSIKTVWDNLMYACVHPYQSSGSCTATTCSGQKYKDDVHCNRYKECMADETIEDKCCPSGQKFDTVSSSCVNIVGDHCTVDSSCYANAQVSGVTCEKDKQPFLIADSTSCDSFSYCPWLVPNAQLQCCPGNLVWKQAIQSCAYPTAVNNGCIRRCVSDVPHNCDFVEMRLCMPLSNSPKDYSRSRFAVTNHGVTFSAADGSNAAYFNNNHDQLKIAGFKNLWNGNTPTDIQISLKLFIVLGNFGQNNWASSTRVKIMSNEDCTNDNSLAMYLQPAGLSHSFYQLSVKLAHKTLTSTVQLSEGHWIPIRFRLYGSTGTLKVRISGNDKTVTDDTVRFTNMKSPLYIGNSGCKLETGPHADMYIRDLEFSEKHF